MPAFIPSRVIKEQQEMISDKDNVLCVPIAMNVLNAIASGTGESMVAFTDRCSSILQLTEMHNIQETVMLAKSSTLDSDSVARLICIKIISNVIHVCANILL